MGTWPHGHLLIEQFLLEKEKNKGIVMDRQMLLTKMERLQHKIVTMQQIVDSLYDEANHIGVLFDELQREIDSIIYPDDYDTQQQVEETTPDWMYPPEFDNGPDEDIPEEFFKESYPGETDDILDPKPIDMEIFGENGESIMLKFPSLYEALTFTRQI
jgi:hypothetical protein